MEPDVECDELCARCVHPCYKAFHTTSVDMIRKEAAKNAADTNK